MKQPAHGAKDQYKRTSYRIRWNGLKGFRLSAIGAGLSMKRGFLDCWLNLIGGEKMENQKIIWECDKCEESDPCILTYGYNQNIFPETCPFNNGDPVWKNTSKNAAIFKQTKKQKTG
jgi:hypothetical protein